MNFLYQARRPFNKLLNFLHSGSRRHYGETIRTGLFAGSFDPPTLGHEDTIKRAATLFDRLIVCIAINPTKKPFLPVPTRVKLLEDISKDLNNVNVVSYDGLLATYASDNNVQYLIRGMRSTTDFEEEYALYIANKEISELDTVFLLCDPRYRHISSSLVREIHQFKGPINHLVPSAVCQELKRSYTRRGLTDRFWL